MSRQFESRKTDVPRQAWDNVFAPSSCLAIITTVDEGGRVNAAPVGTCVRVCHDPMHVAFTVSLDKDTARNVQAQGAFVVNVVPFEQTVLDRMMVCGLPFKPGIDELGRAGLTAIPSRSVAPPRIGECTSHFECELAWTRSWEHRLMVCGAVVAVSADEGCVDEAGFVVWDRLKPAHFCGGGYGNLFVPVHERFIAAELSYEGRDEEFVAGKNWRTAYSPMAGSAQFRRR